MRLSLFAALTAGALLAACSKPEPAAGAPSPDAVTADSTKTPDSTAAVTIDSAKMAVDSTTPATDTAKSLADSTKDSTAATVTDSASKP